jgi:hypothetical protein
VGRRGHVLTVAAIMAATGVALALVVVQTGGEGRKPLTIGGEGSGTVTLDPVLVQPRVPGTTVTPSTPEPTVVPSSDAGRSSVETPTNAPAGELGVNVGSVGGLYPGHRVALGVRYVNPYSFPIAIDSVSVNATGTAKCTARHLMPTRSQRLSLPSGSSVASTIQVGMRVSAPDACQGVRFAVRVRVTAVKL